MSPTTIQIIFGVLCVVVLAVLVLRRRSKTH
jgi:hypothetical protein